MPIHIIRHISTIEEAFACWEKEYKYRDKKDEF
jgi:hypothetical protein